MIYRILHLAQNLADNPFQIMIPFKSVTILVNKLDFLASAAFVTPAHNSLWHEHHAALARWNMFMSLRFQHLFEVAAPLLFAVHHIVKNGDEDVPQIHLWYQSHLHERAN